VPAEEEVDINALVQRALTLRQRLERAQRDLSRIEAEGYGGGGLVRAVMSGENQLVALAIDSSIIDPGDPVTLAEYVREAVNNAATAMAGKRAETMSDATEGLRADLPTRPRSPVVPLIPNRPPAAPRPGEQ
jgi:DNA-binding YbaB/EbfC family protein